MSNLNNLSIQLYKYLLVAAAREAVGREDNPEHTGSSTLTQLSKALAKANISFGA